MGDSGDDFAGVFCEQDHFVDEPGKCFSMINSLYCLELIIREIKAVSLDLKCLTTLTIMPKTIACSKLFEVMRCSVF